MFTIVQCRCCGLVFVNPRLPEEHIKGLYDKAYFDGQGFDPYISLEEEAQKMAGATCVLERISAVKLSPADVLEVGPGGGHFLRLAKECGFSAVGLELSDYAGNRLRQQALHILQGTIERAGIPDHAYDVIVAVEVIKHLPDPRTFFIEVARVLRPGGLFYYETGDIDCEQAREQGADWDYIRPEGHLYYFSPSYPGSVPEGNWVQGPLPIVVQSEQKNRIPPEASGIGEGGGAVFSGEERGARTAIACGLGLASFEAPVPDGAATGRERPMSKPMPIPKREFPGVRDIKTVRWRASVFAGEARALNRPLLSGTNARPCAASEHGLAVHGFERRALCEWLRSWR